MRPCCLPNNAAALPPCIHRPSLCQAGLQLRHREHTLPSAVLLLAAALRSLAGAAFLAAAAFFAAGFSPEASSCAEVGWPSSAGRLPDRCMQVKRGWQAGEWLPTDTLAAGRCAPAGSQAAPTFFTAAAALALDAGLLCDLGSAGAWHGDGRGAATLAGGVQGDNENMAHGSSVGRAEGHGCSAGTLES